MTPDERRASIRHYRERKLCFTDPVKYAEIVARRPRPAEPLRPASRNIPLPDLAPWDVRRLWSMIHRGEPNACWPWLGAKGDKGYGRFKVNGKLYLPHRLVSALENGRFADVPEYHGSVVMHSCDNPSCCNPKHLKPGRQIENVADMFAKGRAHQSKRRLS